MKLETVYRLDAWQSRKEICEKACKDFALNDDLCTASDFWAGAMIEDRKQAKLIMQEYGVKSKPADGIQNYCEAHAVFSNCVKSFLDAVHAAKFEGIDAILTDHRKKALTDSAAALIYFYTNFNFKHDEK